MLGSLPELLEALREKVGAELRVSLPGRVESYDATRQMAHVKPLLMDAYVDAGGVERKRSVPVVANVPVCWPGGGGGFLTFPLAKGDSVLLVFSDRSLDRWLSLGTEVDPVDVRMHHLSDAVAIPCLRATPDVLSTSASDAVLAAPTAGLVRLGAPAAAEAVVLGTTFHAALQALLSALQGAMPALAPAITAFNAVNYLSTKVRAS